MPFESWHLPLSTGCTGKWTCLMLSYACKLGGYKDKSQARPAVSTTKIIKMTWRTCMADMGCTGSCLVGREYRGSLQVPLASYFAGCPRYKILSSKGHQSRPRKNRLLLTYTPLSYPLAFGWVCLSGTARMNKLQLPASHCQRAIGYLWSSDDTFWRRY